jgi:hypothetical protein
VVLAIKFDLVLIGYVMMLLYFDLKIKNSKEPKQINPLKPETDPNNTVTDMVFATQWLPKYTLHH